MFPRHSVIPAVLQRRWDGDSSRHCDLQLQRDRNYCPVSRAELGPAQKRAELPRAMEQLVKRWGGTRGCFCGLVLNNNLFWALLECQEGEMHLQTAGEPQLEGTAK